MKTIRLIAFALAVLIPGAASSQDAPSTTSPEECAATFSARLAAVHGELDEHSRQSNGATTFVQPRHPENEACLIDDARHRIPLVLHPVPSGDPTTDLQRAERMRAALSQLAVMCYGSTRERCASSQRQLHDYVIAMQQIAERAPSNL